MGKEYQTVEVFTCPTCQARQFIEWDPGETERTIPCSSEYIETRIPQQMQDDQGKQITVELVVNAGQRFKCVRGSGDEFQERVLLDLGRETSWQTTRKGIVDPGVDKVLHEVGVIRG
jgi:hypothetical protein